ncbi:MAG: DNA-directed RNA polymerase subunit beta [Candidatus Humimicrobiaceae bacterium]|jgi:DNA-directed RNA polymerase subunit beta|nr:DNA-directed RNA polymerase subunit beta [Candidatus Humimicrobiaceae bacterium]
MQEIKKIHRYNLGKTPDFMNMPHLLDIQRKSFQWFLEEGLMEIFEDISPIEDFTGNMSLEFLTYSFGDFNSTPDECKMQDMSYTAPLKVISRFINKETGEIKEQEVFMGDFPMMTEKGTFIINGTERVVVSQLVRSPGVYFDTEIDKKSETFIYLCKVIPTRGSWIEIETDKKNIAYVRIDRRRKFLLTIFLKAVGFGNNEDLLAIFSPYDKKNCIKNTLEKDLTRTEEEALIEIYKKLRPGEPPTVESSKNLINSLFFNPKRYDFGKVGRYKIDQKLTDETDKDILERLKAINQKMGIDPDEKYILNCKDIYLIVKYLVQLMGGVGEVDDIDHFGNRRVKNVGELIQNQVRIGLSRMERVVRERMTTQDVDTITPKSLINIRPLVASLKEFFGSGQLSQFLDQTNPLAEITHKRRLSALGPGGLSRERAGFEVRDVHPSHYGRMCPIETPEGPNIGLIGSLATFATLNEYGFIETPYRKVTNGKLTNKIEYLSADNEENYIIAEATAKVDKSNRLIEEKIMARLGDDIITVEPELVDYIDVSPMQIFSAAAVLIPFLEHDDANRALMGSNMQRQAVPLINPKPPLVGTGMEEKIAKDSGALVLAIDDGVVEEVSADHITINYEKEKKYTHYLYKFKRSNQGTCINQKPIVKEGEKIKAGQVIADGAATCAGEIALGRNLRVAFMSWGGYNYEDAIIISERLVKEDILSSIHISKQEVEARTTKLGAEEITRDIPSIGEEALKNLDERGIIRIGAEVKPGDILVGKITPKGETELTAEEKLLRAIFGEKAREVRESSLKVPHGEGGKVIDVQVFSRKEGHDLPPGVNELVRVYIAEKRKVSIGDKLAGRHGNKGVISVILPEEDMPYTEDGEPIDIIFNPLGVPSRMNVGQILETHLGWAAYKGWNNKNAGGNEHIYVSNPIFEGVNEAEIVELLKSAGLPGDGKAALYDGRSGEKLSDNITIGYIYVMKLLHLVDDKIHARSTGPYSLVTQQPLGGKAQFGGQRFGEMEVWALEAYGAAYALQEMLTIKSDDVTGRVKTYESIVKGENIEKPGIPESFKVLIKEMQSLALNVEVLSEEGKEIDVEHSEDEIMKTVEELGIDLHRVEDFEKEEVKEVKEVEEVEAKSGEDIKTILKNKKQEDIEAELKEKIKSEASGKKRDKIKK